MNRAANLNAALAAIDAASQAHNDECAYRHRVLQAVHYWIWRGLDDAQIAEQMGVSATYVAGVREREASAIDRHRLVPVVLADRESRARLRADRQRAYGAGP